MNNFTKYVLINLLIFVPIIALVYWITKPSGETTAVSASTKQHFLADANETDRLYNQFKKSVESNDLTQREQDKVNLEQQISIIETNYGASPTFGQIARKVEQNYKRLITLLIAASDNTSEISKQKQTLKEEITKLETENNGLALQVSILKNMPAPANP